jgi:hypothetical protein
LDDNEKPKKSKKKSDARITINKGKKDREKDKEKEKKKKSTKKVSKKDKKYRDDDSDENEEELYEIEDRHGNGGINIIFEMDDARNMQEYNDWFGGDGEDEFEDNENEECNSEDEENFMREKYEKLETPLKKKKPKKEAVIKDEIKENVEDEYMELLDLKKILFNNFITNQKAKF